MSEGLCLLSPNEHPAAIQAEQQGMFDQAQELVQNMLKEAQRQGIPGWMIAQIVADHVGGEYRTLEQLAAEMYD